METSCLFKSATDPKETPGETQFFKIRTHTIIEQ